MTKKSVYVRAIEIDLDDLFSGKTTDEVISTLQTFDSQVEYDKGYYAKFIVTSGYDYFGVELRVYRDETDEEYQKRVLKEEKQKERNMIMQAVKRQNILHQLYKKENDERKEYERLKRKFEIDN